MSGEPPDPGGGGNIRRIRVVLDSSAGGLAAVDVVSALAVRLGAELEALFVEDADLLALAEHTGVSTVSTVSTAHGQLDPSVLRRAIKVQAESVHRAVVAVSEARQLATRFQMRRGRVATEALRAAAGVDLVVMGWESGCVSRHRAGQRVRPGAVARQVAEAAPGSVLLLKEGTVFGGRVLAAYDGTDAARKTVAVAGRLAGNDGGGVEIALLTHRPAEMDAWHGEVKDLLAGLDPGLDVHVLLIPDRSLAQLCRAARHHHAGVMVLGAATRFPDGVLFEDLMERIDCSVLVVR